MPPIPELNEHGWLPAGVHQCTLDEVGRRFGRFRTSGQRQELFARLKAFAEEARATHLLSSLIVDGSFVTSQESPGDVDLILVLREGHDFTAEILPFQYNMLSRRRVRRRYGFDVLVAPENTPLLEEYIAFFKQVRNEPDNEKGILRIDL